VVRRASLTQADCYKSSGATLRTKAYMRNYASGCACEQEEAGEQVLSVSRVGKVDQKQRPRESPFVAAELHRMSKEALILRPKEEGSPKRKMRRYQRAS
jgi:hypothetical protein